MIIIIYVIQVVIFFEIPNKQIFKNISFEE